MALVAAAGGFAIGAVPDKEGRIAACYAKRSGDVRILTKGTKCKRGEKLLRWNQTGPQGPAGEAGAAGARGSDGQTGARGPSAASMLTVNTANVAVPDGITFHPPSGESGIYGDVTFAETLSPNKAVVAQDLAVELGNPPGPGHTYKITFLIAAGDTALTCTVTDPAKTCNNSDARVDVPPGSRIAFKVETTAGASNRRVLLGWRATEP